MPLVVVPTPLGNLRDVTLRALDVLRDCTLIAAEDTRVARRLLQGLGLPGKEIWSYREQNAAGATAPILDRAASELVALVSDAGMPGISDPGCDLIAAARSRGVPVEVLPGPSALLGAAVLSGFPLRRFLFEGFTPRSSAARRSAFARSLALGLPSVWYEAPSRVHAALNDLERVDRNARVFLLREYTKRFEQQISGDPAAVAAALGQPVRGEISLVIAPSEQSQFNAAPAADLDTEVDALLDAGNPIAAIAKTLSARGLGDRRVLYARAANRKRMRRESSSSER